MSQHQPSAVPVLPGRIVVGGYSVDAAGDGPEVGSGLRVLDLVRDADGPGYVTVGHAPLLSPTWVVPHPSRPWLVSISEAAPSELVCTRLEDDGTPTVLGRQTTGGEFGCHLAVSPDGRQVVVAHYGSGSVESFALDDAGQITGPLGRFVSTAPLGPDPDRQDGPHAHQVVLDPRRPGELLVCDLGTDRIHRLRLQPDGELTEAAAAIVLPPGSGPRHLVVADDTLVVACELSVELWVARRDGDGWRPTQTVSTSRRPADERERSTAPVLPSELRLLDDQVLVATRGIDTVSVFALDRELSAVTFVAEVSCGGHHPRDLVVADGVVWLANQWSDEVVALDLDAVVSGQGVTSVGRFSIPRPACVVLLDGPRRPSAVVEESATLPAVNDDLTTGGLVLPITRWEIPVMHARTRPVEEFDDDLRILVRDMFATMEAASGVGLAANQVGRDLAVFVYDCPDDAEVRRVGVVCNPVVELPEGKDRNLDSADEGCLSYPGAYEVLARPDHAICRGQDVDGSPVEIHGDGLLARCLQHETDHLNGIVFGDRLSARARKKLRQQHDELAPRYPADWPVSPRLGPAPEDEDDEDSEL